MIASETATRLPYPCTMMTRKHPNVAPRSHTRSNTPPHTPSTMSAPIRNGTDISLDDLQSIDDLRIKKLQPLLPPSILLDEHPLSEHGSDVVLHGRTAVSNVVKGKDDRLVVVVGPCSIHDPKAALEYATLLREEQVKHERDLVIVMRVYFEKPRTTVGWKGLINDPDLDNSYKINNGLRQARQLLVQVNEMGLPCGCEFLDTISPQFYADCVAWGAIGARTTESQIHRELSSGLSCPVGFKNSTSGDINIACDAVQSAKHPHSFMAVTKQGLAAIAHTTGNPYCSVILRGGANGTNYSAEHVEKVVVELEKRKVANTSVIIDCSHGNSGKKAKNQPAVASDIAKQISGGSRSIAGVMIESHLVEGNQKLKSGLEGLVYGQSITDECLGFNDTKVCGSECLHPHPPFPHCPTPPTDRAGRAGVRRADQAQEAPHAVSRLPTGRSGSTCSVQATQRCPFSYLIASFSPSPHPIFFRFPIAKYSRSCVAA